MNVIITSLFPSSKDIKNTVETKAIMNLIEHEKVLVIYPVYLPYSIKSVLKHLKEPYFKINDIKLLKFPILKIPKSETYLLSIFKLFILSLNKFKPINKIVFHRINLGIKLEKFLDKNKLNYNYVVHASDMELLVKSKVNHENLNFRSYALKKNAELGLNKKLPKASVAYSGIDKSEIISLNKANEKHQNNDKVKIVTVCSLIKLKNVDIVIRKLSAWNNTNWDYTVIGTGPELQNLKSLAQELGVSDKVKFTGKLEHEKVAEYLLNAHYFIMLSQPETFGLVYLEAMSKGCIVFCSLNNGIDGLITNKINGYVVDENNNFTKYLDFIIRNSNFKYKMLKRSMATINQLTKEKATKNYIDNILL